jgi:hypothetical protein
MKLTKSKLKQLIKEELRELKTTQDPNARLETLEKLVLSIVKQLGGSAKLYPGGYQISLPQTQAQREAARRHPVEPDPRFEPEVDKP